MQAKKPTPAEEKDKSVAELNKAKTKEVLAGIEGADADSQLNYMSMAMGKAQDYGH